MGSSEEEKLLQMVHDFIESEPTTSPSLQPHFHNSSCTLNHVKFRHSNRYFTLQEMIRKKTGEERRIEEKIGKHMRNKMEMEKSRGLKQWLVKCLIMDGFHASLSHSSWLTTPSCPCGSYEYIEIAEEDPKEGIQRIIVDIDFKSQFEVARPTQCYKELLSKLPTLFVGKEATLNSIISLLCSASVESLKEQGLHIPPWRTVTYMQSKWKLSNFNSTNCNKISNTKGNEFVSSDGIQPFYLSDNNNSNRGFSSRLEKWVPPCDGEREEKRVKWPWVRVI